MKKIMTIAAGVAVFIASSAYTIQAIVNWKIDNDKASVKFVMQAHGSELNGSFKGVEGDVKFDAADLAGSSFNCAIDVATISTGNEKRDGHMQAAAWFDSASSRKITFASQKISAAAGGYVAEGKLTAKGVSKDVSIPFTFSGDQASGTFKGSFALKRSEFGIGKTDGDVGDDVTVNLEIPVQKSE